MRANPESQGALPQTKHQSLDPVHQDIPAQNQHHYHNLLENKHRLNPPSRNQNKKIWERKNLKIKLEKQIKYNCRPIAGSFPPSHVGQEFQTRANLKAILENFNSYAKIAADGNAFYRVLAAFHIKYILESEHSEQLFDQMCAKIDQQGFDLQLLRNLPDSDLPTHVFKKSKIVQIYKSLIAGLKKKIPRLGYLKAITCMLDTYSIFDFAIIAIYRLYVYYYGFMPVWAQQEEFLQGNEKDLLLTYGSQASPCIMYLVTQCLNCRIHQYSIQKLEVNLTRYGNFQSNQNSEAEPVATSVVDFEFALLREGSRLSLLFREDNHFTNKNKEGLGKGREQKDRRQFVKPRRLTEYNIKLANGNQTQSPKQGTSYKRSKDQGKLTLQTYSGFIKRANASLSFIPGQESLTKNQQQVAVKDEVVCQRFSHYEDQPSPYFNTSFNPQRKEQQVQDGSSIAVLPVAHTTQGNNFVVQQSQIDIYQIVPPVEELNSAIASQQLANLSMQSKEQRSMGLFPSIKKQQQQLYEELYNQLSESERKSIVLEYLHQKMQKEHQDKNQDNNTKPEDSRKAQLFGSTLSNH